MTTALRCFLFAVFTLLVAACGGNKNGKCSACGEGTLCDTNTGQCVAKPPVTAQCSPACAGARPVCDATTNPQNPRCVECLDASHCATGQMCSASQTCLGGGTGGGTGGGGGGPGGSGGTGGSGGGDESDGGTGGGSSGTAGGFVPSTDAGIYTGVGSCAPQDAGVVGGACTPSCSEGFTCIAGNCVLNGGNGPVQVTLRWNTIEDIDLHVVEPLPSGGTCEIYYGDTNQPGDPSSCGALGSLDLDSEAGCAEDHVDIENVIYPAASMAPRGTYSVYVDHYSNCDPNVTVAPFEVEARYNGLSVGMCGVFRNTDPDWENFNATMGRLVLQFTVP